MRLFHITEFASTLMTSSHRRARHPAKLVLYASLWIALVGNLPLWGELINLPESEPSLGLMLKLGVLNTMALFLVLTVLNWAWLLRIAITALLWLTAFNALLLWTGGTPLDLAAFTHAKTLESHVGALVRHLFALSWWQPTLVLGLIAFAPTIWLWNTMLRPVPFVQRLAQNLLLLLTTSCLFVIFWWLSRPMQQVQDWIEHLTPFNVVRGFF